MTVARTGFAFALAQALAGNYDFSTARAAAAPRSKFSVRALPADDREKPKSFARHLDYRTAAHKHATLYTVNLTQYII